MLGRMVMGIGEVVRRSWERVKGEKGKVRRKELLLGRRSLERRGMMLGWERRERRERMRDSFWEL